MPRFKFSKGPIQLQRICHKKGIDNCSSHSYQGINGDFYSLIQTQCTLPLKQFRSASLVMMSTVSIVDVPFFS